MAESVEFFGQQFAPPDRINARRLNQLAVLGKQADAAEKRGDTSASAEVMRDFKALVEALFVMCVRPEDRDRMDALCDEVGPSDEDLMEFVGRIASAVAERPTQPATGSSGGPSSTSTNSAAVSSSPAGEGMAVVQRREQEGRPDLALLTLQSVEARTA